MKTEGEYWDDKVCDEEVLRRIGEKRRTISNRQTHWIGQCFRKNSIEKKAWKGMVRWRKVKGGEDVNNYKKNKDG